MKRSLGDTLILMLAATICFIIIISVIGVIIIESTSPETNTSNAVSQIGHIINTLIGVLAGFLAGKTQKAREDSDKVDNK